MPDRREFIEVSIKSLTGLLLPFPTQLNSNFNTMTKRKVYDVIIVGGSYSGLSSAMALGRALMRVLVIDTGLPCNRTTPHSHNFLTQDGNTPQNISKIGREQLNSYPTVEFMNDKAIKATKTVHGFEIELESGEKILGVKVVFATGIRDILPEIDGFKACWGKSVLHCPFCHGYEVKGQNTGILANGQAAFELAMLISNWTEKLTVYTNGQSTISSEHKKRLSARNIDIVETPISKLEHQEGYLKSIELEGGESKPIEVIYSKVPFEQHCTIPSELGCSINADGYIQIDESHETNIPGIYACGDNVTRMRTVSNAVSMGTATGISISKKIISERF